VEEWRELDRRPGPGCGAGVGSERRPVEGGARQATGLSLGEEKAGGRWMGWSTKGEWYEVVAGDEGVSSLSARENND